MLCKRLTCDNSVEGRKKYCSKECYLIDRSENNPMKNEEIRNKVAKSLKGKSAWNKGKIGIYSEETLQKIKEARANQVFSEESQLKKSESLKKHWSDPINKEKRIKNTSILQKGKVLSEEHKNKIGESNKGKEHSEEQNLLNSEIKKQQWKNNPKRNRIAKFLWENRNKHFCQCGCEQKIKLKRGQFYYGIPSYIEGHNMKGKKNPKVTEFQKLYWTEERKKERSDLYIGKYALDKNPNWNNGSSFEPYGVEFNKELKQFIKNRDFNTCQTPNCMCVKRLSIHHIDFNKKNNNPKNLITLCINCHMKTANIKNKEYFIKYYSEIRDLYL